MIKITDNNPSRWKQNTVKIILFLCLTLSLISTSSWPTYGQAQPVEIQDYVLIEVLLSMQGAVVGGGAGILMMNQIYETFVDCNALLEEQSICLASQEIVSLCAGYAIGLPAGATLGIMLSELLFDVQGNILYALFGSMLGELAGVPQCSLIGFMRQLGFSLSFNPSRDSDLSLILNPFMLSALGAVIGYNFDWLISGGFLETKTQLNLQLFEIRF